MHDKMRDSMRYLYDKDDCTFSKLLKASVIAETESRARHTVKSKAAHVVEVPINPNDSELTSIQNQLDSMTKILKSAQFNKNLAHRQHFQSPGHSALAATGSLLQASNCC